MAGQVAYALTIRAKVTSGINKDGNRPPRPRKGFAPHLDRIEVVIEPEDLPEHAGRSGLGRQCGGGTPVTLTIYVRGRGISMHPNQSAMTVISTPD